MERVQEDDDSRVSTIVDTATSTVSKNYQKYFDTPRVVKKSTSFQVKKNTYSRAKLVLVVLYSTMALMVALFIVNFVIASKISQSIETSKITLQNETALSQTYVNEISKAKNAELEERLIEAGFASGSAEPIIVQSPENITKVSETQEQTNWFNEFTKFISQIFGG